MRYFFWLFLIFWLTTFQSNNVADTQSDRIKDDWVLTNAKYIAENVAKGGLYYESKVVSFHAYVIKVMMDNVQAVQIATRTARKPEVIFLVRVKAGNTYQVRKLYRFNVFISSIEWHSTDRSYVIKSEVVN